MCVCDDLSTAMHVYVHERKNMEHEKKTDYPFNGHSHLPLSDLAVKIPFVSLLVLIAIIVKVLPQWLKRRSISTHSPRDRDREKVMAAFVSYAT